MILGRARLQSCRQLQKTTAFSRRGSPLFLQTVERYSVGPAEGGCPVVGFERLRALVTPMMAVVPTTVVPTFRVVACLLPVRLQTRMRLPTRRVFPPDAQS